jgi:hypothetical protein
VTGWGVALLLAAVGGGTAAGWWAVRAAAADPSEAAAQVRRMRVAEATTTAGLAALVALLSGGLRVGTVLGLLALSIMAGRAVRAGMTAQALMPRGNLGLAYFGLAVVCAAAVLLVSVVTQDWSSGGAVAARRTDPSLLTRDSVRFGVPVEHHEHLPVYSVTHRPAPADAHYGGGIAVPVERWARDGGTLVLQVAHHPACHPGVVAIGPDPDDPATLDVIVLYGRITLASPTSAPPPGPNPPYPAGCGPVGGAEPDHSAIEIDLPAGRTVSAVRDLGASGPAARTG